MKKLFVLVIMPSLIVCTLLMCYGVYSRKNIANENITLTEEARENNDNVALEEISKNIVENVDNTEENIIETDNNVIKEENENIQTYSKAQSQPQSKVDTVIPKDDVKIKEEVKTIESSKTDNTILEEKIDDKKIEIEVQPEVQQEEVKQDKDEYKVNNAMIEQMRNVIQNNESALMQEFGYNIVIDSSIIAETNQFTFTEYRVKNKIINAFGTIKIYAQDYYHNNQYMYTECYLM